MSGWLISIVGIVFLGILFDMIYPNGKTNKLCKSIFGIITLIVMIKPIFKIDINLENKNFINTSLQDDLSDVKINLLEKEIESGLIIQGIDGVIVEIDSNIDDNVFVVKNVYIDITNAVLLKNFENINKYEVIVNVVQKVVNIEKEKVIIYG